MTLLKYSFITRVNVIKIRSLKSHVDIIYVFFCFLFVCLFLLLLFVCFFVCFLFCFCFIFFYSEHKISVAKDLFHSVGIVLID